MPMTMTLVDNGVTIPLATSGAFGPGYAVLVKDWDLGFPTPREVVSDQAGQSGTLDLTQYHGSRTVKLDVQVVDIPGQTRHQTMDILRTACLSNHRPQLFVQADGWNQERVMVLRGTPVSCVIGSTHGAFIEAALAWVCPSGVMTAVGTSEISITPTPSVTIGMSFPMHFSMSWTPGSTTNQSNANNPGNDNTGWVARFYGSATGIAIVNKTTLQKIALSASIPTGHYVEINSQARTALIDGDPAQSVYSTIDFSVSTWWTLAPGVNAIQALAASTDTNAELVFDWQGDFV